jgi:tRNA A37 threonylcarbamoyladenosine biosynthesis protein TsaE
MSAGKSILLMAKHLGKLYHTSSPTFSIVNEYKTVGGQYFHFRLYRLKKTKLKLLDRVMKITFIREVIIQNGCADLLPTYKS